MTTFCPRPPKPRQGVAWLLLALLSQCDREPWIVLYLDRASVPATAKDLLVRVQYDGDAPFEEVKNVHDPKVAIAVANPGVASVHMELVGLDAGGCKLAVSSLTEAVPGGLSRATERSVSLTRLSPALCPLSVELAGGPGTVRSQPPGIDCRDGQTCRADFPVEQPVQLTAQPQDGSHPVWTDVSAQSRSGCNGTAEGCSLSLRGKTTIRVSFVAKDCRPDGFCLQHPIDPTGTPMTHQSLRAVVGSSDNTVYAAGDRGTVLRCKASSGLCTPLASGTTQDLTAVVSSSTGGVYAVGTAGTVLHCAEGSSQCAVLSSGSAQVLGAIGATSDGGIFAVGTSGTILRCHAKWLGCAPVKTESESKESFRAAWGDGGSNVYVVGGAGTIFRCTASGSSCAQISSGTTQGLTAIWGADPYSIYAAGTSNTLVRCAVGGAGCTLLTTNFPQSLSFAAIRGTDSQRVYAVNTGGMVFRCGAGSTVCSAVTSNTTLPLSSIWSPSPQEAYIVGSKGTVLKCSGSADACSALSSGTGEDLNALWGNSQGDLYAVGNAGVVLYRKSSWMTNR